MPRFEQRPKREIPEHERKEVEGSYRDLETRLRSKEIHNAQKWSGVEKQPTVYAENLVAGFKTRVSKRNGDLKSLATFEGLPVNSPTVQSWVERAQTMAVIFRDSGMTTRAISRIESAPTSHQRTNG